MTTNEPAGGAVGSGTPQPAHVFQPAPVYAQRATYTQASCSCGWVEHAMAYVTHREAKAAWEKHADG